MLKEISHSIRQEEKKKRLRTKGEKGEEWIVKSSVDKQQREQSMLMTEKPRLQRKGVANRRDEEQRKEDSREQSAGKEEEKEEEKCRSSAVG